METIILNENTLFDQMIDIYNIGRISRSKVPVSELYKETDKMKEENPEELKKKVVDFISKYVIGLSHNSLSEQAIYKILFRNISIMCAKKLEKGRTGVSPLEKSTRYVVDEKLIDIVHDIINKKAIANANCNNEKTFKDGSKLDYEHALYDFLDFKELEKLYDNNAELREIVEKTINIDEIYNNLFENNKDFINNNVYTEVTESEVPLVNKKGIALIYTFLLMSYANTYYLIRESLKSEFGEEIYKNRKFGLDNLVKDACRDLLPTAYNTDAEVTYNGASLKRVLYNLINSDNLEFINTGEHLIDLLIEKDGVLFNDKVKEILHNHKESISNNSKKEFIDYLEEMGEENYSDLFTQLKTEKLRYDSKIVPRVSYLRINKKFNVPSIDDLKILKNKLLAIQELNLDSDWKTTVFFRDLEFLFGDLEFNTYISYGAFRDIQRHRGMKYDYSDTISALEKPMILRSVNYPYNNDVNITNYLLIKHLIIPVLDIMDNSTLDSLREASNLEYEEINNIFEKTEIILKNGLNTSSRIIDLFLDQIIKSIYSKYEYNPEFLYNFNKIMSQIESYFSLLSHIKFFNCSVDLRALYAMIRDRITPEGNPIYRLYAANLYNQIMKLDVFNFPITSDVNKDELNLQKKLLREILDIMFEPVKPIYENMRIKFIHKELEINTEDFVYFNFMRM